MIRKYIDGGATEANSRVSAPIRLSVAMPLFTLVKISVIP